MIKQSMLKFVMVMLVIPLSLQAGMLGWFGKKDAAEAPDTAPANRVKRLHMTLTDEEAGKELLQLITVKRVLRQERQVLMMLLEEKHRDLANIDNQLSKTFGIRTDRNYRYDAKSMTLFEEGDKPAPVGTAPASVHEPKVVKKMASEADSKRFATLAAAKQIAQEDLTVLARLERAKGLELERVDKALKEKYSMSRDRNYWYDIKTKQLFELVDPASKGAVQ